MDKLVAEDMALRFVQLSSQPAPAAPGAASYAAPAASSSSTKATLSAATGTKVVEMP